MKTCKRLALVLVLCVLGIKPAGATTTSYEFAGTLTRLSVSSSDEAYNDINFWLPGLYQGMPFSGTLSYDGSSGWNEFLVELGSYPFRGDGELYVHNDGPEDSLVFYDYRPEILSPPATPFYYADDLVMTLSDPTGTVLSDENFPLGNLEQFPEGRIVFGGGFDIITPNASVSSWIVWDASITYFQAVQSIPEPSSFTLCGLGLAALFLRSKTGRGAGMEKL